MTEVDLLYSRFTGSRDLLQWAVGWQQKHRRKLYCKSELSQHNAPR